MQAPTPELTSAGDRSALVSGSKEQHELFKSLDVAGGGEFFARNGLLFLPHRRAQGRMIELVGQAEPLIQVLASDPSLRGLTQTLSFGLMGVQGGQTTLDAMTRPLTMTADTVEHVLAGEKASFSWRELVAGKRGQASASCGTSSWSGRCSTSPRSSPARRRATPSGRPRPISSLRDDYQATRAAHRPGADGG